MLSMLYNMLSMSFNMLYDMLSMLCLTFLVLNRALKLAMVGHKMAQKIQRKFGVSRRYHTNTHLRTLSPHFTPFHRITPTFTPLHPITPHYTHFHPLSPHYAPLHPITHELQRLVFWSLLKGCADDIKKIENFRDIWCSKNFPEPKIV